MSKNLSVSLRVQLQGTATKELTQQLKGLRSEMLSVANVASKLNSEILKLAAGFKLAIAEGRGLTSALAQVSGQATLLGGRSRTLSGDVNLVGRSLQNGARYAERMRRELERLRQVPPPRPLPPNGGGLGGGNAGGTGGIVGNSTAAVAAGGALVTVLQVKKVTDYDLALAHASNVAYADKGVTARIAGKSTLNEQVLAAARYGGTSKEQALETYNALVSQGVEGFKGKDAANVLPFLLKTATAANADPTEIANIALKSVQSLGLSKSDAPKVLEMALKAGQEGGFELKDMAKWLPEQMAYMRKAGLGGMEGLASVMAANQISIVTSGSTDAAGNNLVNLIGKINSSDTANDLKKLDIDLGGRLANAKAKGKNGLEAFIELADGIAEKDPRLQKIKSEMAKSSTTDEKRKLMNEQIDILGGSSLAKIVQDRQAMSALVALMYNREKYEEIKKAVIEAQNSKGIDTNYGVVSDSSSAKFKELATESNNAYYNGMKGVTAKLGEMAQSTANMIREYPKFTAAIGTATFALTLLAAAALGKRAIAGAAGGAAGGALGGAAAGAGLMAGIMGVGKMAVPALLGAGALGIAAVGAGGTAAALGGYGLGTWGRSFMDEGGATDNWIGEKAAWIWGHGFGSNTAKEALSFNEQLANLPAPNVTVNVQLDSQHIANTVETKVTRQAQRQ